jgi:hypothetical protein
MSTATEVVAKGLVPFVAGDLVKLALAGITLPGAWWIVGRQR